MNPENKAEAIITAAKSHAYGGRHRIKSMMQVIGVFLLACIAGLATFMALELFSSSQSAPSLWLVAVVLLIAGVGTAISSALRKTHPVLSSFVTGATYLLVAVAVHVGYGV